MIRTDSFKRRRKSAVTMQKEIVTLLEQESHLETRYQKALQNAERKKSRAASLAAQARTEILEQAEKEAEQILRSGRKHAVALAKQLVESRKDIIRQRELGDEDITALAKELLAEVTPT